MYTFSTVYKFITECPEKTVFSELYWRHNLGTQCPEKIIFSAQPRYTEGLGLPPATTLLKRISYSSILTRLPWSSVFSRLCSSVSTSSSRQSTQEICLGALSVIWSTSLLWYHPCSIYSHTTLHWPLPPSVVLSFRKKSRRLLHPFSCVWMEEVKLGKVKGHWGLPAAGPVQAGSQIEGIRFPVPSLSH